MADTKTKETKEETQPVEKLPTVAIQGKEYVLVKDRILAFNKLYPSGSINTDLVEYKNGQFIVKAIIHTDMEKQPVRFFTAYSQEKEGSNYINKTSALENAETSAVGRALAMMGIGVIESVASADEVHKAINHQNDDPQWTREPVQEATQTQVPQGAVVCSTCGQQAYEKRGVSKSGKNYHGVFCSSQDGNHTKWLAV